MATRAQKAKVGVFVMLCMGILAGVLLLIRGFNYEKRIPYWLEFDESILGLGPGGMVEYLGVEVGKVDDIYVTQENKVHVDVLIRPSKATLHEGVTGQLVIYSMATGTMVISLRGGELKKPMLPPGSEITTEPSLLKTASDQIQGVMDQINSLLSTVKDGLCGMKEGDLNAMLQEAKGVLTRGREFVGNADTTLSDVKGDVKKGLENFNKLAEGVQELVKKLDETVAVTKEKIEKLDVAGTGDSLNKVLADISALAKRLQDSAKTIDNITSSALHKAGNVEYDMRETLRTLTETLDAVRQLSVNLQRDPSSVLWGKGKPSGEKR